MNPARPEYPQVAGKTYSRLKDALKHKNEGDRMHEILNLIDPPLRKGHRGV